MPHGRNPAWTPTPWLVIDDADHAYETSIATLKHVALKEFLREHPEHYEIDGNYCDFFGYNATWCTNGFLRKLDPGVVRSQQEREIEKARELVNRSESDAAFAILNALKAQCVRVQDIDYLRALCFVARKELLAAIEALKEELESCQSRFSSFEARGHGRFRQTPVMRL